MSEVHKVAVGDEIKVSFTGKVESLSGGWMTVRNPVGGIAHKIFEGLSWDKGLPNGVEVVHKVKAGQIWETTSGERYATLEHPQLGGGGLFFYHVDGTTYSRSIEEKDFFKGKGMGAKLIFGG